MITIRAATFGFFWCALASHAQVAGQLSTFIPFSPTEKVRYNFVNAVRPSDFLQTALGAGLAQWRNAPYEWEQGWDAYGTRYGSRFAQHLVKRAAMTGIQMIDGEDPRRIRSQRVGLWPRALDAVKYTFVTQRDHGGRGFAYSRVIGSYTGGLASRTWHPERTRTIANGLTAGTISLGVETGMSVLNEFLPDLLRKIRLR